jgi:hypothetical protein
MWKLAIFGTEIAVALMLNMTANLFDREDAIDFTRWGWEFLAAQGTFLLLSEEHVREFAHSIRRRLQIKWLILAYVLVATLACGLLMLYWQAIDSIYARFEPRLVFTGQPLSEYHQRRVTREIRSIRRYLGSIGFDLQGSPVPPISIIKHGSSALPPWAIVTSLSPSRYGDSLSLGSTSASSNPSIDTMYLSYFVSRFLQDMNGRSTEEAVLLNFDSSSYLYSSYLISSYRNVAPDDPHGSAWEQALWYMRRERGQQFMDRVVYYSMMQFDSAKLLSEKRWDGEKHKSFDRFFAARLESGFSVMDPFSVIAFHNALVKFKLLVVTPGGNHP